MHSRLMWRLIGSKENQIFAVVPSTNSRQDSHSLLQQEEMAMFVICSTNGVRHKYGTAADQILAAVGQLGTLVDVSGLPPEQIRSKISQLAAGPACLIGGYD